jgi:peptidoglycan/LPS O-acetylase OafA/YrhL
MYLALPILFLLLKVSGRAVLPTIYIISLLLSLLYPLFRYVPCFLAGVIAYRLLEIVRPRWRSWLWLPAILGCIAIYTLTSYYDLAKDALFCLFIVPLIPLFRKNRNGFISAAASKIATYSYGIYLCHTPVLWLLYQKLPLPNWARLILLAVLMVTIPVLCYRWIEQPLIRMGIWLSSRATVRPKMASAVAA